MADTISKTMKTQIRKKLGDGTYQVEHPETTIENVLGKATKSEAEEGVDDTKYMTPKKTKDFIIAYGDGAHYIYNNGYFGDYKFEGQRLGGQYTYFTSSSVEEFEDMRISARLNVTEKTDNEPILTKFPVFIALKDIIDLSDYNFIVIENLVLDKWSSYESILGDAGIFITDSKEISLDNIVAKSVVDKNSDKTIIDRLVLNINSLNGLYYVKIGMTCFGRKANRYQVLTFDKLYLTNSI